MVWHCIYIQHIAFRVDLDSDFFCIIAVHDLFWPIRSGRFQGLGLSRSGRSDGLNRDHDEVEVSGQSRKWDRRGGGGGRRRVGAESWKLKYQKLVGTSSLASDEDDREEELRLGIAIHGLGTFKQIRDRQ